MPIVLTLVQLISLTSSYTHRPIVADPQICERFSVIIPQDLDPSEAKAVLFTALETHSFNLVPTVEGNKIKSSRSHYMVDGKCEEQAPTMVTMLLRRPNSLGFNKEKRMMEKLLSKDGQMELVWGSSSIAVSDHKENIESIQKAFQRL